MKLSKTLFAALFTAVVFLAPTYVFSENGSVEFKLQPGHYTPQADCSFLKLNLPENTKIYAGGSKGGTKLGFRIEESPYAQLASTVKVVVNSPYDPVVLILLGGQPIIWQIGWTESSKIMAVLLVGNDNQLISGLPEEIPLVISTQQQKNPCGNVTIYEDIQAQNDLRGVSKKLFGREPELMPTKLYEQEVIIFGKSLPPNVKMYTAKEFNPADFRLPGSPASGQEGLDEALKNGWIRKATTEDDIQWWKKRHEREKQEAMRQGKTIPEFKYKPGIGLQDSYFILDPQFVIPDTDRDLFIRFYLPAGLPTPKGGTHYSIEFLEDGTYCSSPGPCNHRR